MNGSEHINPSQVRYLAGMQILLRNDQQGRVDLILNELAGLPDHEVNVILGTVSTTLLSIVDQVLESHPDRERILGELTNQCDFYRITKLADGTDTRGTGDDESP